MPTDEKQRRDLELAVLETVISSLEAQLRSVIRLRDNLPRPRKKRAVSPSSSRSQLDLVEDVLTRAGTPLHIQDIIARVEKIHGLVLDRESIVSALSKKIHRGERFQRTDKNVFALLADRS